MQIITQWRPLIVLLLAAILGRGLIEGQPSEAKSAERPSASPSMTLCAPSREGPSSGVPEARRGDRRLDSSRLRVMTFNGYFLWDGIEPEEGQTSFSWKGSPDEAGEHMQDIASVIIEHDPDIVNLVEVEGLDALNRLNDEFLAGRGYSAFLVKGKDTYTGQDLGVLSRIDPLEPIARDDNRVAVGSTQRGVSKNYFLKLRASDEMKIALVGVHFLARPNSEDRKPHREGQAKVIRNRAVALAEEGYEVIVLGDFNDYDGNSATLDHIGSRPISSVMNTIRWMGQGDTSDDLVNVASKLDRADRYTAWWDRNQSDGVDFPDELTSIDHILVSPALSKVIESVVIPKDIDLTTVSDHLPIIVTFRLGAAAVEEPGAAGEVRIVALLPNSVGNEQETEAVTLRSTSGTVDLSGWMLRDDDDTAWDLSEDGSVGTDERVILRNGRKMAMSNRGDLVELIDPSGRVVQSVRYGRVHEGELVVVGD